MINIYLKNAQASYSDFRTTKILIFFQLNRYGGEIKEKIL